MYFLNYLFEAYMDWLNKKKITYKGRLSIINIDLCKNNNARI